MKKKRIVIALGHEALGSTLPEQQKAAARTAKAVADFMRKEHFDYVLLDCAPIGAAIDAAVIAKHCDGAILVIAQGMASGRLIQTVKKQMEASGVRVLGAVLNKVRMKKSGYEGGYYGGYYGSYYGNYGEHHEKNA